MGDYALAEKLIDERVAAAVEDMRAKCEAIARLANFLVPGITYGDGFSDARSEIVDAIASLKTSV